MLAMIETALEATGASQLTDATLDAIEPASDGLEPRLGRMALLRPTLRAGFGQSHPLDSREVEVSSDRIVRNILLPSWEQPRRQ